MNEKNRSILLLGFLFVILSAGIMGFFFGIQSDEHTMFTLGLIIGGPILTILAVLAIIFSWPQKGFSGLAVLVCAFAILCEFVGFGGLIGTLTLSAGVPAITVMANLAFAAFFIIAGEVGFYAIFHDKKPNEDEES